MTKKRLAEILAELQGKNAAVVGDAALDAYWYADMRRAELSRETPHYNRPISREVYSGGGMANVALNLSALGVGRVGLFTVLGDDWRGRILQGILEEAGIDFSGVVWSKERFTTTFLKPMLLGYEAIQEAPRFDFLADESPDGDTTDRLLARLEGSLDAFQCVLVGDQVPAGVVTEALIRELSRLSRDHADVIFTADSRYSIEKFAGMVWKPNAMEAMRASGMSSVEPMAEQERGAESMAACAERLLAKGARRVFITLGEDGCMAADEKEVRRIPAIPAPPPIDVVGAGDAFHAAMAAALASGASLEEAGFLGNLAASVTVRKIGTTGTATPEELADLHGHVSG